MALSFAVHGLFAGIWVIGSLVNVVAPAGVLERSPEIAILRRASAQPFSSPSRSILQTELPPLPLVPVDPVEAVPAFESETQELELLDPLLEEDRFEELSLEPLTVEKEESPASEEREAIEEEPVGEEAVPVRALLESPEVSYPRAAYLRKHEGTVMLSLHVNPAGVVTEVEVIQSSGHLLLDRAALSAARGYLFEAGEEDMTVQKSFSFRLP